MDETRGKDSALQQLMQQGQSQEVKQKIIAIASIINAAPVKDKFPYHAFNSVTNYMSLKQLMFVETHIRLSLISGNVILHLFQFLHMVYMQLFHGWYGW